jgi:translation initiation factor 5B
VKITAKDLEKAIAGLNLLVAFHPDEVEICKEEVAHELKSALGRIKLQDRGVYVQASTLGSLEALLEFLKTSEIPVRLKKNNFRNNKTSLKKNIFIAVC